MKKIIILVSVLLVIAAFFILKNRKSIKKSISTFVKKTEISISIRELEIKGDPMCFVAKSGNKVESCMKNGKLVLRRPISWKGIPGEVSYYNLGEKSAVIYYFNVSGVSVYVGCIGSEFKKVEEKAQNLYYETLKDLVQK